MDTSRIKYRILSVEQSIGKKFVHILNRNEFKNVKKVSEFMVAFNAHKVADEDMEIMVRDVQSSISGAKGKVQRTSKKVFELIYPTHKYVFDFNFSSAGMGSIEKVIHV